MKTKLPKQTDDVSFNNNLNIPDRSPIIPQRSKIKYNLNIKENFVFTEKQKEFIKLATDKNTKLLFVEGPSGSTKSYMAVYCALKLLNEKKISDLIYIRSIVESATSKLGYLPGEINLKVSPYMEILYDKLDELLPKNEIELLRREERIVGIPPNFLRGKNFNAKFIFVDESQNLTTKELITIMTRVGCYSKIILAADPEQSDINSHSGFVKMMNTFDDQESRDNGIYTFRFTEEDIKRSELVKFIVKRLRT